MGLTNPSHGIQGIDRHKTKAKSGRQKTHPVLFSHYFFYHNGLRGTRLFVNISRIDK